MSAPILGRFDVGPIRAALLAANGISSETREDTDFMRRYANAYGMLRNVRVKPIVAGQRPHF
jgi:hypothetical protein